MCLKFVIIYSILCPYWLTLNYNCVHNTLHNLILYTFFIDFITIKEAHIDNIVIINYVPTKSIFELLTSYFRIFYFLTDNYHSSCNYFTIYSFMTLHRQLPRHA